MKFSVSFSLFVSSIAVSSSASDAFASNGRTRTALSFGVPTKHHLSRSQHTTIDINSSRTNRNNLSFVRGGARYESTATDSSSEVSASVVRGGSLESGNEKTNIIQSLASKPLTKAMLSSTLFVLTDMIIKTIFKAKSISFPSSLAGCCFLAATLLTTPFHETLYRVLNPGAKLMQKFMMIFLVPNLIILPLCGGSYSVMEVSYRYYNGKEHASCLLLVLLCLYFTTMTRIQYFLMCFFLPLNSLTYIFSYCVLFLSTVFIYTINNDDNYRCPRL